MESVILIFTLPILISLERLSNTLWIRIQAPYGYVFKHPMDTCSSTLWIRIQAPYGYVSIASKIAFLSFFLCERKHLQIVFI